MAALPIEKYLHGRLGPLEVMSVALADFATHQTARPSSSYSWCLVGCKLF